MAPVLFHLSLMIFSAAVVTTAAFVALRKKKMWLKLHRMLALSGVISALAAFAVMFIAKAANHYPHFASPHALLGLAAVVFFVAVPFGGFLSTKGHPGLRVYHRWGGRAAIVIAITAAVTGILRFLSA